MSRSKPVQPITEAEAPTEPIEPIEPIETTEPLEPTPQATVAPAQEPIYNTALYQALGVMICPICGDKPRSNAAGSRICVQQREDCPNADPDSR